MSNASFFSSSDSDAHPKDALWAPSAARNAPPIAALLQQWLPSDADVLEIACGTGQHAAFFSKSVASWNWQPSDREDSAFESVRAWGKAEGGLGWKEPIILDVTQKDWGLTVPLDAIVCINMIHISPWEACEGLMRGAARHLKPTGSLVLYGPYYIEGRPTAPSNERFNQSLQSRDPRWGIRHLHAVEACANQNGLQLKEFVDMPANNISVHFQK